MSPEEIVRLWWNDCCRRTWREDFEDPVRREQLLQELCRRLREKTWA